MALRWIFFFDHCQLGYLVHLMNYPATVFINICNYLYHQQQTTWHTALFSRNCIPLRYLATTAMTG